MDHNTMSGMKIGNKQPDSEPGLYDEEYGEIATTEEMKEEALRRLELFGVCDEALSIFKDGGIPVTLITGELGKEKSVLHDRMIEKVMEEEEKCFPFYIVESKKFKPGDIYEPYDVVMLLYVNRFKDEWEEERKSLIENGIHNGYVCNLDKSEYSEFGGVEYSINNGLIVRRF